MNAQHNITTLPDVAIAFPSVAALRAAHTHLLKQQQGQPENSSDLLNAIEQFIQCGRAAGALIDGDDERWACQSLLDYWSTVLYRAGRPVTDATLVAFDPSLLPTLDDSLCPYLGLEAFQETHHDCFFGRQRLLETLSRHLKDHKLLALVGSSGSGKSSVIMSGLLPQLKAGALPDSQNWYYYPPLVPGINPLRALVHRLQPSGASEAWLQEQESLLQQDDQHLLKLITQAHSETTVVLCIDQFEEVFSTEGARDNQSAFVQNLLQLVQAPGVDHRVILTMRIDFEDKVVCIPGFREAFEQARIQVTPLDAGELREAIEKPGKLVGLKFEDGLVDALIKDVLGEPSALPLLQFTLLKLWEKRDHNRLTWQAYQQLGGGRRALTNSADEFYNGLIPQQQGTAKRILLSMVQIKEGVEYVSKRILRQVLYQSGEACDQVDAVLNKLIQARLVKLTESEFPNEAQVEVAHEALIRNWGSLRDWLRDEWKIQRQRVHLRALAEQWQSHDHDPKLTLRGRLLQEAQDYEGLDKLTHEFVQFSIQTEQEEAAAERKHWKEKLQLEEQLRYKEKLRYEEKLRMQRQLQLRRNLVIGSVVIAVVLSGLLAWTSHLHNVAKEQEKLAKEQEKLAKEQEKLAKEQEKLAKEALSRLQIEQLKTNKAEEKVKKLCKQIPAKNDIASKNETIGFQALLSGDLTQARLKLQQASKDSPCFHSIDEIYNQILTQKTVSQYKNSAPQQQGKILRDIYQVIVNKYSLGISSDIIKQMQNRRNVKVEYFPKTKDSPAIQQVVNSQLTALGFMTETKPAKLQEPTNNLAFGQDVDLGTIKLVAKELLQKPGVRITVIDPFTKLTAEQEKQFAYKIQIGTDLLKGNNCLPWTVSAIEAVQNKNEFQGCLQSVAQ